MDPSFRPDGSSLPPTIIEIMKNASYENNWTTRIKSELKNKKILDAVKDWANANDSLIRNSNNPKLREMVQIAKNEEEFTKEEAEYKVFTAVADFFGSVADFFRAQGNRQHFLDEDLVLLHNGFTTPKEIADLLFEKGANGQLKRLLQPEEINILLSWKDEKGLNLFEDMERFMDFKPLMNQLSDQQIRDQFRSQKDFETAMTIADRKIPQDIRPTSPSIQDEVNERSSSFKANSKNPLEALLNMLPKISEEPLGKEDAQEVAEYISVLKSVVRDLEYKEGYTFLQAFKPGEIYPLKLTAEIVDAIDKRLEEKNIHPAKSIKLKPGQTIYLKMADSFLFVIEAMPRRNEL